MTSAPVKDGFRFQCDDCGEEWIPPRLGRGSDSPDWHDCWERAKSAGWRAVKVRSKTGKDDWEHRCPSCN